MRNIAKGEDGVGFKGFVGCSHSGSSVMDHPSYPATREKGLNFEGYCGMREVEIFEVSPHHFSQPSLPFHSPFSGVAPPYQCPSVPNLSISAFQSQFPLARLNILSESFNYVKTKPSSPHGALILGTVSQGDTKFSQMGGFQIKGLSPSKMAKVCEVLSSLDIKETKREVCDRRFVGSVWSVRNKEWAALPACGASGWILIIWDSKKMSVYGPNNPSTRKDFWVELLDLFGLTFPSWCVGENVNDMIPYYGMRLLLGQTCKSHRCVRDWIGSSIQMSGSFPILKAFKKFFLDGHRIIGRLFWIPILSSEAQHLLGSRICGCNIIVSKSALAVGGENLKEMVGKERKKIILDEIANIDANEQEGALSSDLAAQRVVRKGELEEIILREEIHWRQKAKVKWVKDGDYNSKLFHKVANGRRNRNFIKFLENERGLVLDNFESIIEEILLYFKKLYSSPPGESWRVEDRDKTPGPDGFTIAVFQDCWDVIKEDLTIHSTQGAFVQGRQILDAVLIANEIVDEKRRSGEEGVVFKIDFEKAYDYVKWDFLDHVLEKKGFSSKWRSWMRGCLSSVSYAILVNGNAKGWVKASRGLRQGDPLSHFLFTIVVDVLSRMLLKADERSLLEGFRVGKNGCRVSHLQFADDTILFANSSKEELQTLKSLLLVFGQVSGLKVNLDKSNLFGINLDQNHLSRLTLMLDCKASDWPILYLGLPLGGNPTAYSSFSGCKSREDAKGLSLVRGGGRQKRHLVSWDAVCKPRVKGGLGIGKIPLRNRTLLGKWLWRFPRECTTLWHQVILSIYGTHSNGWDANTLVRWSHRCPWKAIA
ncbi:LINE-1 retrotransposable element ORF2 protein [Vitis vinifera]|uniref:LINE-1 retrotransposable element ORF2 protein n=1 Tax=Vitis vinifera TaxID=29760 RepID=A0A438HFU9_VITVI|nr:LINE-1 retrotransposable element ORF2 protein [Vitis vinifera]